MMTAREATRARWAHHVQSWKASGQTQSHYCRQHNLKTHQLTYWIQVFKEKAGAIPSVSSKFIPVQIASSHSDGLVLHWANGLRLEGIHAENLTLVRELVEALS